MVMNTGEMLRPTVLKKEHAHCSSGDMETVSVPKYIHIHIYTEIYKCRNKLKGYTSKY